ncbi:MAG: rhodanese-like protein, partial [Burkholderiales bacterium]|nr:rhodanese-like protein [Burkholderiales bacterium]
SQEAGEALERAGFTRVFNVKHGFEGELDEHHHRNTRAGWRYEGLPWEQC